ncbi:MAG: RNA polymerase sigma-70 factor (ECF subfamily) [Candidatus Azotimanducaceae bacterium]
MTADASDQEAALIARVQGGDGAAFQVLLQQNLPVIHRYASRMLGNPTEAADIAQEVFIRFWQKSATFDSSRAKLSTWLHQIAHNLCMDFFRKHSRLTGLDELDEPESQPLETELGQEQKNEVMKSLIGKLPERQRSALILCHYQGLSNRQTAVILDITIDALESLLSRARRTLKNNLREQSL